MSVNKNMYTLIVLESFLVLSKLKMVCFELIAFRYEANSSTTKKMAIFIHARKKNLLSQFRYLYVFM